MKKSIGLAIAIATLGAGTAQSADLSWESSASLRIRVTIAPVGAALAAADAGAAGLWTIGAGGRGLMIDAPPSLVAGEPTELALLAVQTGALHVMSLSPDVTVLRAAASTDRGFGRQAFTLFSTARSANDAALIVISTR